MERKKNLYRSLIAAILLLGSLVVTAQTGGLPVMPDGRASKRAGASVVFAAPIPLSNSAPIARFVAVQGNSEVGQTLSVVFLYEDADSDPQGAHVYQWYRADDAAGGNTVAISSATSATYQLTAADQGKYIMAGVTPVATSGASPGYEVIAGAGLVTAPNSAPVGGNQTGAILVTPDGRALTGAGGSVIFATPATSVAPNAAPVAGTVTVQGTAVVGQTLNVTFAYTDTENDPQGASTYQWYRADDAAGGNSMAIGSATSASYQLTAADQGKYITAGVTPVATSGASPGLEAKATYAGPVTVANAAPVAGSVAIQGTAVVGQTLNVTFTYTDADSDPQGASTYQWYRADDAAGGNSMAISSATSATYVLTTADQGKYITAGVTPVATSGASPGLEAKATYVGPVTAVASCPATIVVNHVAGDTSPETVDITYGVVKTTLFTGTDKCAITRNLGATTQATAATDNTSASAGWYWQFNRKQGYKHEGVTRTPNTTWTSNINESSDWLPANDPCTLLLGTGWRMPTQTEWTYAIGSSGGNWTNYTNAYNSVLKMHAAGILDYSSGALNARSGYGYYWSSTQDLPTIGNFMIIFPFGALMYNDYKANGLSVRCLSDL